MRATINFEFDSSELETFATSVFVKGIAGAVGRISEDPMAIQGVLAGMQQTIGMVLNGVVQQRRGPPMGRVYTGPPPGYGPMGPGPMPYGSPGPVQQDPSNVHPIREPASVERCFPIEATRNIEAGWGCHGCATFNGSQRTVCRYCGHQRCDSTINPPPPQQQPPQVQPPEVP